MSIVAFDTLSFVKTIEDSGVSRTQAEAIARAVGGLRVEANGFAMRDDFLQHEKEIGLIQRDIVEIKKEISLIQRDVADIKATMTTTMATKSELELLKRDITIRLGSMIMALGGVLIAVKFLG